MTCRYAAIKDFDMNQSDNISVSLWMQGCEHQCDGCQNSETWDFGKGKPFTDDTIDYIIHLLTKDNIHKNLSVLGGESLSLNKIDMLCRLFKKVKDLNHDVEIWVWTGYELKEVQHLPVMEYIDVLIDGKYEKDLHCISRYFGSSNQKLHRLNK